MFRVWVIRYGAFVKRTLAGAGEVTPQPPTASALHSRVSQVDRYLAEATNT